MPKCLDCNNEETFLVSYVTWDKLYFSPGDANAYDSKSLDTSLDESHMPKCAECNSTNVEGDF